MPKRPNSRPGGDDWISDLIVILTLPFWAVTALLWIIILTLPISALIIFWIRRLAGAD